MCKKEKYNKFNIKFINNIEKKYIYWYKYLWIYSERNVFNLKYYTFKTENKKKFHIKHWIIISIVIILIILIGVLTYLYSKNEAVRDFLDKNILRKDITEEDLPKIEINPEIESYIYAYNNQIVILQENKLQIYNSDARKEHELEITISNPLFESNNRFLAIAEKDGRKLYLISKGNILWQMDLDGNISKININKNGYISLILSENIIVTVNPEGKELFRTFLSKTYGVDTDISDDNKYLAIAECITSRN